jgi:two-component system response regulator AtoC
MGRVLIVDDDRDFCELLVADLKDRGWDALFVTEAEEAMAAPPDPELDVVLTDLRMPGVDGLSLCRRVVESRPDVPVVVMTAFGSLETAVAAIRAGAYDFVTKPIEADALHLTLERALRHRRLTHQVRVLESAVERAHSFDQLTGDSEPMKRLFDTLARVAETEVSVLIVGESGSGKELVARALHERGPRRSGAFVPVNCAAIPAALVESELFGHAKGAFTDARSARRGLFEEASGGTLFLDEVGEIPLALQPKLLRAFEEGSVRPVGSNEARPVDVRLVCATNRDLEEAIEEGRFRADLYFRINVVQVDVPPLRGRGRDILLLAHKFLERFAGQQGKPVRGISRPVAEKLLAYRWPGNVRELRNCIERAVALTRFEEIAVEDLPDKIRSARSTDLVVAGNDPAELVPMDVIEERYIRHVLEAVGGHRTRAARILGLDRKTLYRKLAKYGALDD